jgi:hypothetical protein
LRNSIRTDEVIAEALRRDAGIPILSRLQRRPFHGTNLAAPWSSMQKHLSVKTQRAGIVHINCQSGQMFWEEESLDPVVRQYAKKYLVQEGFLEQAIGALDPQINESADLFLEDISN